MAVARTQTAMRPQTAPRAGSSAEHTRSSAAAVVATAARLLPPTAPPRAHPTSAGSGGAGLDPQRRLVGVRHQDHLKWLETKKRWEAQEQKRYVAAARLHAAREKEADARRKKGEAWSVKRGASLECLSLGWTRYYDELQYALWEKAQLAAKSVPAAAAGRPRQSETHLFYAEVNLRTHPTLLPARPQGYAF